MVVNNWWYFCVAEGCVQHSAKELQQIHSHSTGAKPGRPAATNRDRGSKAGGREPIKFPRVDVTVADPGCLSRIPDPVFYPSRIPDPNTATIERVKKKIS